jgi:toxin ParE1/3/4
VVARLGPGEGAPSPAPPLKVFWSVRALRDIEAIYEYVGTDKPEAARRLAERLMLAGDGLNTHPWLGRDARVGGLRELIVGNYLLIYRARVEIEIVTWFTEVVRNDAECEIALEAQEEPDGSPGEAISIVPSAVLVSNCFP